MPDPDDHIAIPVDWVVLDNDTDTNILILSVPLYLQEWLQQNYLLDNYLIRSMEKPYDEIIGNGAWFYINP